MPRHDRVHDRPVEPPEPFGGGSVVALGRVEVAVDHGQLGERVRTSRHLERVVGGRSVEVEHDQSAAAGLVEVAAAPPAARRRTSAPTPSTSRRRGARRSRARSARSSSQCSDSPARKSRRPRPVSASARVRSSASPPQANASSSQRRPSTTMPVSQCGQAGAAGDHQRGLRVVVGDGPVERGSEVVVLSVHRGRATHVAGRR